MVSLTVFNGDIQCYVCDDCADPNSLDESWLVACGAPVLQTNLLHPTSTISAVTSTISIAEIQTSTSNTISNSPSWIHLATTTIPENTTNENQEPHKISSTENSNTVKIISTENRISSSEALSVDIFTKASKATSTYITELPRATSDLSSRTKYITKVKVTASDETSTVNSQSSTETSSVEIFLKTTDAISKKITDFTKTTESNFSLEKRNTLKISASGKTETENIPSSTGASPFYIFSNTTDESYSDITELTNGTGVIATDASSEDRFSTITDATSSDFTESTPITSTTRINVSIATEQNQIATTEWTTEPTSVDRFSEINAESMQKTDTPAGMTHVLSLATYTIGYMETELISNIQNNKADIISTTMADVFAETIDESIPINQSYSATLITTAEEIEETTTETTIPSNDGNVANSRSFVWDILNSIFPWLTPTKSPVENSNTEQVQFITNNPENKNNTFRTTSIISTTHEARVETTTTESQSTEAATESDSKIIPQIYFTNPYWSIPDTDVIPDRYHQKRNLNLQSPFAPIRFQCFKRTHHNSKSSRIKLVRSLLSS